MAEEGAPRETTGKRQRYGRRGNGILDSDGDERDVPCSLLLKNQLSKHKRAGALHKISKLPSEPCALDWLSLVLARIQVEIVSVPEVKFFEQERVNLGSYIKNIESSQSIQLAFIRVSFFDLCSAPRAIYQRATDHSSTEV